MNKKNFIFTGKIVHSRWLTTANRVLRLYVGTNNPPEKIVILVTFIMKSYAPMWFSIKMNPSIFWGAKHTHKQILLSRYLPEEFKKVIDPVIQRNSFFAHAECVLLSMLSDPDHEIRKLAYSRIEISRQSMNNSIRQYKIPELVWDAQKYYEIIDWQQVNVTEPPMLRQMSLDEIKKIVANPKEIENLPNYPCHTQAVERGVKMVTEAASVVCGVEKRDAWIKTTIQSREKMPTFFSKKNYVLDK